MLFKSIISIATFIALLTPLGAQATPINNISISGPGNYSVYQLPQGQTTGILQPVTSPTINDIENIFINNSRVGNVQLGSYLLPNNQTSMTVNFAGGSTATFSNPLLLDWIDNDNALIKSYISAAANSVSIAPLNSTQMGTAITTFLNIAWPRVSDPNIAKIDLVNGQIKVGLDGILYPANFLSGLLGVQAPAGAQASEVVKVSLNGGSSQYLYSFSATDTGYQTGDGTQSYNGRYNAQTIPEPTTLLLLGFGFMGLGFMQRHKKITSQ